MSLVKEVKSDKSGLLVNSLILYYVVYFYNILIVWFYILMVVVFKVLCYVCVANITFLIKYR
jgi:hypothetical protein